ncbi:Response regulator receiver domain-containing protein [Halomicrobium zhouii]|uniref:Response regulator receiver domain-containing protein n=1 Tax=Halomicrobium zhouii TaxID=767519 RepID=A0A1I6KLW3_9EURY|nr:response regulator [Halomicrobium zhouii]SFR91880.1 Response regulator receiver domain-containing protein [Halomicrobium zhouii]
MSTQISNRTTDGPIDVLLVEDNLGDVRLTREAFSETPGETAIAVVQHGDDALERLTRAARTDDHDLPDIVLLDLNLPGRDGHEILEAIRADARLRRLPVVVLTSSEAPEDVERSYDADANAYLTKPTDPANFVELAEAVEEFWFDHAHLPPFPR